MIYLFLLVWVPFFTYLAERQFKRVKEKPSSVASNNFATIKQFFKKHKTKTKKKFSEGETQLIKVLPITEKKISVKQDPKVDSIPAIFKRKESHPNFDEFSDSENIIKIRFKKNPNNSFSSDLFASVEHNTDGTKPTIRKSKGRLIKPVAREYSFETVRTPIDTNIKREGVLINRDVNADGILDSKSRRETQIDGDMTKHRVSDLSLENADTIEYANPESEKDNVDSHVDQNKSSMVDSNLILDSDRLMRRRNLKFKFFGWALMLVAILPPSIVAGMKNYDVGGDISYVIGTIETVKTEPNFVSYMENDTYPNYGKEGTHQRTLEDGYKVFVYMVGKILPDPHFLLFLMQFITIALVALFAYKFRDKTNMSFVMAIYMLIWYMLSFTMMRQSISIALILYSLTFFRRKQYIRTLVLFLLAISLHISSVVAIGVYVLMFISQSSWKKRTKRIIYSIIGAMLLGGVVIFEPLMQFLTFTIPVIPDRYYLYMTSYKTMEFDGDLSELIPRLLYISCAVLYIVVMRKRHSKIDMTFVLMLLLVDLSFIFLNFRIGTLFRMGFYYLYPALFFLVPNLPYIAKHKSNRKYIALACIVFLCALWVYKIPYKNDQSVFPYRSDILHLSVVSDDGDSTKNSEPPTLLGEIKYG